LGLTPISDVSVTRGVGRAEAYGSSLHLFQSLAGCARESTLPVFDN
jgi:hypothetical protein